MVLDLNLIFELNPDLLHEDWACYPIHYSGLPTSSRMTAKFSREFEEENLSALETSLPMQSAREIVAPIPAFTNTWCADITTNRLQIYTL